MKIKTILRLIGILIFLYVAFFSIQNFYQGYHDVDLSFNLLKLGAVQDTNTSGQTFLLDEIYLRGIWRMTYSFVWMTLDCLFAIVIGYLWRKNDVK